MPLVPARLRMWQEPHLATNSCLPLTMLSPWSVKPPQPLMRAMTPVAATPSASPRTDLLSIGGES